MRADELANEPGNLINRVVTLINRFRVAKPAPINPAPAPGPRELRARARRLSTRIDAALAEFDFRQASAAIAELTSDARERRLILCQT